MVLFVYLFRFVDFLIELTETRGALQKCSLLFHFIAKTRIATTAANQRTTSSLGMAMRYDLMAFLRRLEDLNDSSQMEPSEAREVATHNRIYCIVWQSGYSSTS
jgi:hypothetical protein